jgi:hypothetical protein
MDITDWLQAAIADAERRGLGELRPLLQSLAQATDVLRRADWDDEGPASFRSGETAGTGRGPA